MRMNLIFERFKEDRVRQILESIQTSIFFVSEFPSQTPEDIQNFLTHFTETRIRKVNYLGNLRISKYLPVSRFTSFREAFQASLSSSKKFILILSPGQWFESEFFLELTEALKRWRNGTIFMGHILDHFKRNQYLDLHPMSLVINVDEFKEVFSATCLERCFRAPSSEKEVFETFLRSKDNHHDNYTPLWIEPIPMGHHQLYARRFSFLVEYALKRGKKIESFPEVLRSLKFYCYPQFTHQAIRQVISGKGELISLEDCYHKPKVYECLMNYLKDKRDKQSELYWTNNEPVFCHDFRRPFDRFVGLASGLKLFLQFALSPRVPCAKILVFDENTYQLEWFKKILSFDRLTDVFNWTKKLHGEKPELLEKFLYPRVVFQGMTQPGKPERVHLLSLQPEWEEFRNCTFQFLNIDFLVDQREVFKFIEGADRCHVWLSNVFDYHWKMYVWGYPHLEEKFYRLLKELGSMVPPCFTEIYRPAGGLIHMWSDDFQSLRGGIHTLSK